MQKKLTATAITLVVLVALVSTGCGRRETMMNDGQMMEHMRSNPQMMGQMMSDPDMMQQMMSRMMGDPDMMQQMMGQMMSNPDMMARMMSNPQMMQQMADHMSRNPEACRNMMQAMAARMDPASAQAMIGHCDAMMGTASAGTTPSSSAASAPSSSSGAQEATVNVVGTGFSPASLNVKKGQLFRIHFKRDGKPTCAEEVIFPEMNIRKKLPANQTTTVELSPQKEGTLNFACGMEMMKGKLVVS